MASGTRKCTSTAGRSPRYFSTRHPSIWHRHGQRVECSVSAPLYIIRNARLDPDWASVERKTMTVAARAIASLTQTQGVGDLYRIYLTTQRDGVDYNLALHPTQLQRSTPRRIRHPVYAAAVCDGISTRQGRISLGKISTRLFPATIGNDPTPLVRGLCRAIRTAPRGL